MLSMLASLVLVCPDHRLPQLDLVSLRIDDPGELAVLVRLRPLQDVDAGSLQAGDQLEKIVDPVVDHERRVARPEPFAVPFGDVPGRDAAILGRVVGPPEDRAAELLERYLEMISIPGRESAAVLSRLEEDAADAGDPRHRSLPPP